MVHNVDFFKATPWIPQCAVIADYASTKEAILNLASDRHNPIEWVDEAIRILTYCSVRSLGALQKLVRDLPDEVYAQDWIIVHFDKLQWFNLHPAAKLFVLEYAHACQIGANEFTIVPPCPDIPQHLVDMSSFTFPDDTNCVACAPCFSIPGDHIKQIKNMVGDTHFGKWLGTLTLPPRSSGDSANVASHAASSNALCSESRGDTSKQISAPIALENLMKIGKVDHVDYVRQFQVVVVDCPITKNCYFYHVPLTEEDRNVADARCFGQHTYDKHQGWGTIAPTTFTSGLDSCGVSVFRICNKARRQTSGSSNCPDGGGPQLDISRCHAKVEVNKLVRQCRRLRPTGFAFCGLHARSASRKRGEFLFDTQALQPGKLASRDITATAAETGNVVAVRKDKQPRWYSRISMLHFAKKIGLRDVDALSDEQFEQGLRQVHLYLSMHPKVCAASSLVAGHGPETAKDRFSDVAYYVGSPQRFAYYDYSVFHRFLSPLSPIQAQELDFDIALRKTNQFLSRLNVVRGVRADEKYKGPQCFSQYGEGQRFAFAIHTSASPRTALDSNDQIRLGGLQLWVLQLRTKELRSKKRRRPRSQTCGLIAQHALTTENSATRRSARLAAKKRPHSKTDEATP